jgi:hypothetical protein
LNSGAIRQRSFFFKPIVVLFFSFAGASLYALYMLRSAGFKPSVFNFSGSFFYVVPIIVPFVAFLFDRAEHLAQSRVIKHIIDILVVAAAIGRVVANLPFISGHTLFLTYALFCSRSRLVKISAAVVMLQVLYLKYIVWHDWVTSTSGIVFGLLAAYIANRFEPQRKEQTHG